MRMGLRDLELPTETIMVSDDSGFVVRGLAFSDIAALATAHGPALTMLYSRFVEEKQSGFRPETMGMLLTVALEQAPQAVAHAIALAAGEPDMADKVARLRPTVQAEALEKVVGLTFVSEADVKKLVEIVTRIMEGMSATVNRLQKPLSDSGIGDSASR